MMKKPFFSLDFWRKKRVLYFFLCIFFFVLFTPSVFLFLNAFGKIFEKEEISLFSSEGNDKKVILVFGAGILGKNPSTIFSDRLIVASELYFSKKAKKILLSGDNSYQYYNEPESGKNFLKNLGIPPEDIILDYAGFRTHDSCARAKKIFGVSNAYLVTQKFHLPRAIFYCEQFGIKSIGVSSSLHSYQGTFKNYFRESLAHQNAFYEIFFFPHDPKFLGAEEFILNTTEDNFK